MTRPGTGLAKDKAAADGWIRRASELGHTEATYTLGRDLLMQAAAAAEGPPPTTPKPRKGRRKKHETTLMMRPQGTKAGSAFAPQIQALWKGTPC